jgi:hypothetical protein
MQTLTDELLLSSGTYVRLHWHNDHKTELVAQKTENGKLVNAYSGDEITEHKLKNWNRGDKFTVASEE